ncbi:hypothetical protein E2C01_038362 [Portunus trituberculatus]|uniref:Uncharacterized protein n=1 Tax=Portunus trituberculatus TaxID=210409 RepID=A0A5B7FK00_PORTR|nr:hypothetical protein [Portunus trituberculatus]
MVAFLLRNEVRARTDRSSGPLRRQPVLNEVKVLFALPLACNTQESAVLVAAGAACVVAVVQRVAHLTTVWCHRS